MIELELADEGAETLLPEVEACTGIAAEHCAEEHLLACHRPGPTNRTNFRAYASR